MKLIRPDQLAAELGLSLDAPEWEIVDLLLRNCDCCDTQDAAGGQLLFTSPGRFYCEPMTPQSDDV